MGAQNTSRMSATTVVRKRAEVLQTLVELAAAGDPEAEKAAEELAAAWVPSMLNALGGVIIIAASEAMLKAFTPGPISMDGLGTRSNDN